MVEESGLYDEAYYRSQVPAFEDLDPLNHYLTEGWRLGYDPSRSFSSFFYYSAYPDVEASKVSPLVHFVEHGRAEGRVGLPLDDMPSVPGEVPEPTLPTIAEWRLVAERIDRGEEAVVDVVVPVYRGFTETLRCLFSVLANTQKTKFRVVVVYDHGPDTSLHNALVWLSELGLIDLRTTPRNMGFVAACNAGLAEHPLRDAVMLNSDTQVYGDWLDRLRAAAYGGAKVATVTPFSNNAEICSYPRFVHNNRAQIELSDEDLDQVMAVVNRDMTIEIPTGVGFCMYVRRDALDEIGYLSEEHFGRGYGEENDLCRRAAAKGWSNLLAADVFVRHYGGRSFGSDKSHLVEAAVRKVESLHPGYGALVHHFLQRDPAKPLRGAVDLARIKRRHAGRPSFLFVAHNWGGGTERHVRELAERLEQDGVPVLICRPSSDKLDHVSLFDLHLPDLYNLPQFSLRKGPSEFAELLVSLNVMHIHVHQIIDFDGPAADFFRKLSDILPCEYDVTLHDYAYICPRITLVNEFNQYCGEPDVDTCERCVRDVRNVTHGSQGVWEWRERSAHFLRDARKVFVPSRDTARRYARYLPDREFTVRPHFGTDLDTEIQTERSPGEGTGKTIIIIGALGPPKGSALVYDCAKIALKTYPDLRFHIIGYTDRDDLFEELGNVSITGRYDEKDLGQILRNQVACAAWFPAVWPETFSYTLSAAFAARLMPIAFDFGAIAERIRAAEWGVLLPPEYMLNPDTLVDSLATFDVLPVPERIGMGPQYPQIVRDYYDAPAAWAGIGRRVQ